MTELIPTRTFVDLVVVDHDSFSAACKSGKSTKANNIMTQVLNILPDPSASGQSCSFNTRDQCKRRASTQFRFCFGFFHPSRSFFVLHRSSTIHISDRSKSFQSRHVCSSAEFYIRSHGWSLTMTCLLIYLGQSRFYRWFCRILLISLDSPPTFSAARF